MDAVVSESGGGAARLTADGIGARVGERPELVLGLATGRTMEPVYAALVSLFRTGAVSFAGARTVNLDEYIGLAAKERGSFAREMHGRFSGHVDVDPCNIHLPNGMPAEADAEADRHEGLIDELRGIDLQLLGIGRTGHIGFNEPPSPLDSCTRPVTLDGATREQNAPEFGGVLFVCRSGRSPWASQRSWRRVS